MLSRLRTSINGDTPGEAELGAATFAGGCFWCIDAVFREMEGVEKVVSGYTGGVTVNPTYFQVCSGQTGHAEAVQISFDNFRVSYRELLAVFFAIHDPTTLNRQGADTGNQYRSAIFYHSERQRAIAEQFIKEMDKSGLWQRRIVTQIVPLYTFYTAEDCHQEYYSRNPEQDYCRTVIAPKLSKIRRQWAGWVKELHR